MHGGCDTLALWKFMSSEASQIGDALLGHLVTPLVFTSDCDTCTHKCPPRCSIVGLWIEINLRIFVALAIFQPYRDLGARDNQFLKSWRRDPESNPGALGPQPKELIKYTTAAPCSVVNEAVLSYMYSVYRATVFMKYTWAPQTVHNTPVMNILKGYFYIILF